MIPSACAKRTIFGFFSNSDSTRCCIDREFLASQSLLGFLPLGLRLRARLPFRLSGARAGTKDPPSKTGTSHANVIAIIENRLERLGTFKEAEGVFPNRRLHNPFLLAHSPRVSRSEVTVFGGMVSCPNACPTSEPVAFRPCTRRN